METVAERTAIGFSLRYELESRLPKTHEALAYFVISEAVTNAAKHARACTVMVAVTRDGATMRATIVDDGVGGAVPSGGGLSGLAGRVAALDGQFRIDSPVGGPTTITMELPCE